MRAAALIGLVVLLALPAAANGQRSLRGTDNRFFAGVGWDHAPRSLGWAATMRLDKARAVDWPQGGYVAQTLWWATNSKFLPYGNSRGRPYVQLALSRGHQGRPALTGVLSQRTAAGNYHEMVDRTDVKLGESYGYSVIGTIGGVWKLSQHGFGEVAEVQGQGPEPYSSSVFAGIESTSPESFAKGRVEGLTWLTQTGAAVTPLPGWLVQARPEWGSKPVQRGPGRVRWDEQYHSFDVRFGARRR